MSGSGPRHQHVFLGQGNRQAERNLWATIALTLAMMAIEIVGGAWFGSIALVADGFHMSTHAGALSMAAIAYALARRWAHDPRFTFGTGKFGDLAGFSSALALGMIAVEIGWEAVGRLFSPRPIAFAEALPIAALGLLINLASAGLLSRGGGNHHHHREDHDHDEARTVEIAARTYRLSLIEDGAGARFRLQGALTGETASVETLRPDGARRKFEFSARDGHLESGADVPEPHSFEARLIVDGHQAIVAFAEHSHGGLDRDHNFRAAFLHIIADAAVSALVIVGLTLAYAFGWLFLDPLAALVGALVIASWSYQLIRDTGAVLLDMNPDGKLGESLRTAVEREGDALTDLHLWRLGPGHLGAIVSIETARAKDCAYYRRVLEGVAQFSHLTVEVVAVKDAAAPRREVARAT